MVQTVLRDSNTNLRATMNPGKLKALRYIILAINIGLIVSDVMLIDHYRNSGILFYFMFPEWMLFVEMACAVGLIYFAFRRTDRVAPDLPDVLDAATVRQKSNRAQVRKTYLSLVLSILNYWTHFALVMLREMWLY